VSRSFLISWDAFEAIILPRASRESSALLACFTAPLVMWKRNVPHP